MKNTIITILISMALTCICLFVINYFNLFGYYLPHKSQVVYMSPFDVSVTAHPEYISIPSGGEPKPLVIYSSYPSFGVDNVNHEWVVVFEGDHLDVPAPASFPLKTKILPDLHRYIIFVPMEIK